jgi:cell division protein FtsB
MFNQKEKVMKKFNYPNPHPKMLNVGLSVAAAILVAGCASIPAPTEQLAVSKMAVTNATSAGGNEFAPLQLKSAMEKLDAAEKAMSQEDYVLARQLAEQAQVDAQLAAATARSAKAQKAVGVLQEDNSVLRQELNRKAQ